MPNKIGLIKEDAVVIRSIRHSESSRIITLFGRTLGKFAVIAKGVRRTKSRAVSGGLEAPSQIEVVLYYKPQRSVQNLAQVTLLNGYSHIKSDLVLTGYAAVIMEHLGRLFIEEEPNEDAYHIACRHLQLLDEGAGSPRIILWKFQLELLRAVGYALDPFPCPVCGASVAEVGRRNMLLLDQGAICCQNCIPQNGNIHFTLSGESVSILRRLRDIGLTSLNRLKPSRAAVGELSRALDIYLRHHHPNVVSLPALKILEQLEKG